MISNGVPYGIRTRVAAVKGRCPKPLDEGDKSLTFIYMVIYIYFIFYLKKKKLFMRILFKIFILTLLLSLDKAALAKATSNSMCFIRGVEIIFPYKQAVFEIKEIFKNLPDKKRNELSKFKNNFEQNFYGIPLYKEAGCSNARLSEYLECLAFTDGKNCKIYYTQMRIVD